MADDTTPSLPRDERGGRPSGGRPPGNREPGGFRIRLSDNEMRAARAIQESFGLRSTVAALGFSIRTVAQLLETGQLDELVAQQRAQGGNRGGGAPRGERRPERERGPRIDPFARPSKPAAPAPEPVEAPEQVEAPPLDSAAADLEASTDAVAEVSSDTVSES